MARARTIKPSFFKNEQLAECSCEARLFFIGLWTLADRDGRLEYRPKRIKAELFPFDAVNVHELAVELHGQKLLILYESDGAHYIAIPTFKQHQRPHPKEPSLHLPQPVVTKATYDKAVEKNGEPCKETASCALYPYIPISLYPSILTSGEPEKEISQPGKKAFQKPTVAEVKAYCNERRNQIDPEHFVDYYEARGWKLSRGPMKDWQAAIRTWEKNQPKKPTASNRIVTPEEGQRWNPITGLDG